MPLRSINQAGLDLIKSFEGIPDGDKTTPNFDPYLDPVGIWTIGYGHAITVGGKFLRGAADKQRAYALYPGGITLKQAEDLLNGELVNYGRDVLAAVKVELTDNQFAALVSFAFNAGVSALRSSTLLKKLNNGDYTGAAAEFAKWNKGTINGKKVELKGLTRRRAAEAALFLKA